MSNMHVQTENDLQSPSSSVKFFRVKGLYIDNLYKICTKRLPYIDIDSLCIDLVQRFVLHISQNMDIGNAPQTEDNAAIQLQLELDDTFE